MTSSDSYYTAVLNNTYIYLNQYVVPVFYVLGNVGNLLSALIFSKKSWRKKVCVFYFNICLLFNTCYINSVILASIFSFVFNINLLNSSVVLCKVFFYVTYLFSALFPTALTLASIDRLLISSQNVDTRLYSSKRLAYFSLSISTFIWFVFYFHILIKINIQELYPSVFVCYYDLSSLYLNFISYSTLIINSIFCLLMIILCTLSFQNVRHIRIVPHQQRNQGRSMTKKDFQLLRCLFVQDIVYTICSVPLTVYIAYETATLYQRETPLGEAIHNFTNNVSNFIHYIPFCASFFIFVIVSKAFRHELKRMIHKMFGKEIVVIPDEENRQENVGRDNLELNGAVNSVVLRA